MVEGLARSSRFPAIRSRVIVWISLAFPTVLLVAILTSMLAAGSAPVAAEVIIGLCLLPVVALVVRTIVGFDLTIDDHQLIYRAALRTYRINRSLVVGVTIDDANSSNGLGKLKMANLHRKDGTTMPLKLFNSFRPSEASPEPLGYPRMQEMAQGVSEWAKPSPARADVP